MKYTIYKIYNIIKNYIIFILMSNNLCYKKIKLNNNDKYVIHIICIYIKNSMLFIFIYKI